MEEWTRMEAPLLEIDDLLAQFAKDRDLKIVTNYHNWPSRSLDWARDGIYRSIQILAADKPETYHMGVVAWEDKNNQRYGADKWLRKWVYWGEIRDNLHQLLEEAVATLESWSEKDLKPSKT